jgi:hypothetical protein
MAEKFPLHQKAPSDRAVEAERFFWVDGSSENGALFDVQGGCDFNDAGLDQGPDWALEVNSKTNGELKRAPADKLTDVPRRGVVRKFNAKLFQHKVLGQRKVAWTAHVGFSEPFVDPQGLFKEKHGLGAFANGKRETVVERVGQLVHETGEYRHLFLQK